MDNRKTFLAATFAAIAIAVVQILATTEAQALTVRLAQQL